MRYLWLILPLSLPFLGILVLRRDLQELLRMRDFASGYLQKLTDYCRSRGKDEGAYVWLVRHAERMQRQVGADAVFAVYKPPGAGYAFQNYEIFVNVPALLRREYREEGLSPSTLIDGYATMIRDAILRNMGRLDEVEEDLRKKSGSPVEWARLGMSWLLARPLEVLGWIGLLSTTRIHAARRSPLMRILAGIVSILALFSSVIGVVVGWPHFIGILGGNP